MIDGFLKFTIDIKQEYDCYLHKTEGFIPSSHYYCEALVWDFVYSKYYKIIEGYFCTLVYVKSVDKIAFMPPLGEYKKETFDKVIYILYEEMKKLNRELHFYEVPELMKDRINQVAGLEKDIHYKRSSSEYLYQVDDFKNTFNKQSIRYAYNHFIKHHHVEIQIIDESNVACCNDITKYYCEAHNCDDCRFGCEMNVSNNIVNNYSKLDLQGILVEVDSEMAAFAIVEKMNKDICFHFKKHKYGIRGINEYIHKTIVEMYHEDSEIEWINYTDDMNIPGLRQYKTGLCSYSLKDIYEISVTKREGQA